MNPVGSTLQKRYQILEQLSQERYVTAYLAIDLQIPGNLQLKCVIHRYEIADPSPDSTDWYRAALSAQALHALSRQIDQLPIIYSYFADGTAFYLVRELILSNPLAQELLAKRPWSQSQVVMLLVDLLEVLHEIDRYGATPDPVAIDQIVRRHLDRKLVLINLPILHQTYRPDLNLVRDNLRAVGQIAIAAVTGSSEVNQIDPDWHQLAPQIEQPELVELLDRLITNDPTAQYPSVKAAWQVVARVMSKLLIQQHTLPNPHGEIAKHVQVLVNLGTGYYEIGDCRRAIVEYDRALAIDDRCVEAYCGRGNARRYQGDYAGSWADFNAAIQLDSNCGIAYIGRALATCFGHQPDANAGIDFQRGQNLLADPANAIEYVMRGTAKAQLHDHQGAIDDYTQAINLNPRLVLAYNNRGNLREHVNDVDGAIADFSHVLAINPNSPIAHNNRAIIYTRIGQFSAAIADYQQAIKLQPEFISVYNNQGNTYCQMGEYANAIDLYSQAIDLDPEFAVAYSNRANIHRIQGDFVTALVDYDQAIDLDSELVIAYYNRGICHRQLGNHQSAIDNYTHTLKLDPQYFYAYYHRGNARKYLGDKHGAIADYTQTIYFDPNHIYAYYNRAITRSEIGDMHGSMADLERAIELQPTFSLAYYQRGLLLTIHGEHKYALPNYQQAIELNPNYLDAYYQSGCSHQRLGNLSAAVANFSHSINIDHNYAPAYYQRAKIYAQLGDRTGAITDYHRAASLYLDRADSKTYQQILRSIDRLAVGN